MLIAIILNIPKLSNFSQLGIEAHDSLVRVAVE
jgi:hypothetical protein